MGSGIEIGKSITSKSHAIRQEMLVGFERVIWQREANVHSSTDAAKQVGMDQTIASGQNQLAILHQMLEETFGEGWIRGGKIAARWICPVYADDVITPHGQVIDISTVDDRRRARLVVNCRNQHGVMTGTGTAEAFID